MFFRYLEYEWKSKYPNDEQDLSFLTKMTGTNVDVPLQTNYFDCGIYLLQYVESFFTVNYYFLFNLLNCF